jgi:hypothetical protein
MSVQPRALAVMALLAASSLAGCSRSSMTLDPAVLPGCAAGHGEVVKVSWDAAGVGARGVQIYINRPGATPRPWTQGKAKGSRKTGRWSTDGLTFALRDRDGNVLARRTLETSRCPRKQKDE